MTPWEVIEHTADVGLLATGPDLGSAVSALIVGFGRLVCPEGPVEARHQREVVVEADRLKDLVVDALDELNFVLQTEGFLPAGCQASLEPPGPDGGGTLTLRLDGDMYDPERHGHLMEVKATTYHDLVVEAPPGGDARIQVIFDI